MKCKIGILNLGLNNIKSVVSFFSKFGNVLIFDNISNNQIDNNLDLLVIPGNGNFLSGTKSLSDRGFVNVIQNFKKKVIGICLGMQLLFETSEENDNCEGLKLIKGKVLKIKYQKMKLPLLGWYKTFDKNNEESNFFFNNNYACIPENKNIVVKSIKTEEGNLVAMIKYKNIYGIQFHPEKSSLNGYNLLKKIINDKI